MFSKVYIAISIAIALGFSAYAPAHHASPRELNNPDAQQVSDEINGLLLTLTLPHTRLAHRDIRCTDHGVEQYQQRHPEQSHQRHPEQNPQRHPEQYSQRHPEQSEGSPCPSGDASVAFELIIKNVSAETKTLTFPSTQLVELEVLDATGASVGYLSATRSYGAMLTALTLAPGEEKALNDALVLDRSVTGTFQVVASVPSFEALPRLTQTIEVLAAP